MLLSEGDAERRKWWHLLGQRKLGFWDQAVGFIIRLGAENNKMCF